MSAPVAEHPVRLKSAPGLIRLRSDVVKIVWLVVAVVAMASLQASAQGLDSDSPEISLASESQSILNEIDVLVGEYREFKARVLSEEDDENKAIAELQAQKRLVAWMRAIGRLVDNLEKQKEQGLDTTTLLQKTRTILWGIERQIPTFMEENLAKNADLRAALANAPAETAATTAARLDASDDIIDEAIRFHLSLVQYLDRLNLGSTRTRTRAAETLDERAGDLAARLELASQALDSAKALPADVGAAEKQSAVLEAQETFDHLATSLWTTCDVMDELDLPTAEYRQVLILATGELTADILDREIISGLTTDAVETARRWLEQGGPAIVGRTAIFLSILVVFWLLARFVRFVVPRIVASSGEQLSELAGRVIVGTTSRIVLIIGLLVALSQVGVNVTALLAGVGIVGFIIGFALQDTLGNFAAGTMILIYRPFDVGDVIEAGGVFGTVDHMTLVSTRILTFDNQTMIVPNTRIWGNVIRNATALEVRRVDLSFPLALDVDVKSAEGLFDEMCRAHPNVLEDPEPAIKIQKIAGTGVLFVVRPWVKTEDYWQTYWDLNREASIRLKEAGIRIAPPRLELETRSE